MNSDQQMTHQFWMDCFKLGIELAGSSNPPIVYNEHGEIINPKTYMFEYVEELAHNAVQTYLNTFKNNFNVVVTELTLGQKFQTLQDPNCPPKLLEKLADDEDYWVRFYVARHPNCSLKLLEKLADDEDGDVRSRVAEHPNCPQYLKNKIQARQ